MENWGLVTYPKEYLLFDPAVDTIQRQLNITQAIAHEFSHQWFGNLVTPVWWSQLWISEGFCTLFNTLAADMVCLQKLFLSLANRKITSIEKYANMGLNVMRFRYILNGIILNTSSLNIFIQFCGMMRSQTQNQ